MRTDQPPDAAPPRATPAPPPAGGAGAAAGGAGGTPVVGVLGPLRAGIGGRAVDLGGPRQRAVLARLVAAGGHVVPTDRFIDDLWQGVPPPKALAALQVYVSNLRRALEPGRAPRTPASVLVTVAPGYALHLPTGAVDAWRFEALLRDGSAIAERDPARADGLLREALAAWAGPAYAEFADEPWAVPEVGRLEELRLVCVEAGGRVAVRLGRAALVVPALERHVRAHPLREEAVHLLASALYAAGRQGDALAALRAARDRLATELGVDPGPGLRALEADVLAQAPHLAGGGEARPADPAPRAAAPDVPEPAATAAAPPSGPPTWPASSDDVQGKPGSATTSEGFGRERELAALGRIAEEVLRDGVRVMWVGGEAGAGKTTVLRMFAARLGWRVAWGRCPEVDGAPPAWAWSEVLRALPRDGAAADARLAPLLSAGSGAAAERQGPPASNHTAAPATASLAASAAAPATASLATSIAASIAASAPASLATSTAASAAAPAAASAAAPAAASAAAEHFGTPAPDHATAEHLGPPASGHAAGPVGGGQFALAQAVAEHLSGFGPLLVVLDDVHRADGETLQVLRHVAVTLEDRPLLLVATHRPGESQPDLDAVRAALAGRRAADVDLGGLDADAGRALLRSLGVPGVALDVLVERTGGNPLFLTETARLVSAEGADSAVRAIPSGIGHVLRRRLSRLPATAQTVLRHAAVLGRDVDIDVLVAAEGSAEDTVLDGLEAGVVSGLLEEPAAGRVRFTHALLRDVLYDDMPLLRRRRLHARVLTALEELGSADVAALGYHALAAATPATADTAAGYAAAAARQATGLYAHREAATLYRGALDAGPLPPARRHDLLCGLTSALANAGDVTAARAARAEALRAAADAGVPAYAALTAYDAPVAWTIRAERAVDTALVAQLEAALAASPGTAPETAPGTVPGTKPGTKLAASPGTVPDAATRCRLLVALVYELEGDDLARCDAASAEALTLAGDDPLLRCHALNARYFAVLNPARRHELPAVGARLLEEATAAGLVQFQAQAHHVLFQAALERNDLAAAQEHVDRAVRHATAGQLGVALSVMALFGAVRALLAGDPATAERLYTELTARIARTGQPNAALVGIAGVFFVHLATGSTDTLLPMLRPVYERLPDALNDFMVRALLDAGQVEEARRIWSPDAVAVREDYYWLAWMGLRGWNAAALRSEPHARDCYAALLPWAGQFVGLASGSLTGPPVDLILADLAGVLGLPEAAAAHRAAGHALAAAIGAVPWLVSPSGR
ncbi:BTAD domain-containing putative transcriptional regulator [Dactylosporangium aurantiacum]|uniref:BTAD domain-containing putative transcriptional regulator n=1 Tax=Dactylosporangium aurantiacum TaxID=35754 RepID=UPI00243594DE|nr:BTAD domain-containing putative transcriptional regulator [Dactylosporangium aurantiacum]MDG6105177.1 BTAD domain-containing putative transcriptional regulator [Dactylosporangium aurantiacum]